MFNYFAQVILQAFKFMYVTNMYLTNDVKNFESFVASHCPKFLVEVSLKSNKI